MTARARAIIDLGALRHNLNQVRRHAPRSGIMCAVKANGYGHGAVSVARALDGADALAVATLGEGLELDQIRRFAAIGQKMLVESLDDSPGDMTEHENRLIDLFQPVAV